MRKGTCMYKSSCTSLHGTAGKQALTNIRIKSWGCLTGRELYALAWVVEAASPAIDRTLAGIEEVDSVAISVPDVPTVPSSALYGLFAQVRAAALQAT